MVGLLRAAGVEFSYKAGKQEVQALSGIDIEIDGGEMLAILGPNGAGKSTLLRLLAGLLKPTSGQLQLEGRDVGQWSARERARRIALVPQSSSAMPEVTVEAFVGYGRYAWNRVLEGPKAEDRNAVSEALAAANLVDLRERPLAELSGGQRQRALMARALAQEARILLVDEPTNALDPGHQLRILELLAALSSRGRAVVVVTHELNLASQFVQRALLLDGGRAVACAPIEEVLVPEILEPVYGSELIFGSLEAAGGRGKRPFVLPWKKPER